MMATEGRGALSENNKLVVVQRDQYVESEHYGHIAVVNAKGELIHSIGDPERNVFARSALKPFQALPLLQSGAAERFLLSDKELAICCGSHNGEEQHVQTVASILLRLGLEETSLQCGVHSPYDLGSSEKLLIRGQKPDVLHNNCSGKHAGMLALAMHLQSDTATYHQLGHPVQKLISNVILQLAELKEEKLTATIDGCGVPAFGLPLAKLARMYALLAEPESSGSHSMRQGLSRIAASMTAFPEMVGGQDVLCTDLMKASGGTIVAKGGAEGVYGLALCKHGIGVAIKIEDGSSRAAYPAAVETLRQLGVLSSEELEVLECYHRPLLYNHRAERIGEIRPVFRLG